MSLTPSQLTVGRSIPQNIHPAARPHSSMAVVLCALKDSEDAVEGEYKRSRGVKYLAELGRLERIPNKYILPANERPKMKEICKSAEHEYNVPVIDISGLDGSQRVHVVKAIGRACEQSGFFQVVNHGVPASLLNDMMKVASEFFELPFEEKRKYASTDITRPMRYGTSFNQEHDRVFCWRDFLKHSCNPLSQMAHLWPSNPPDYRSVASSYSEEVRSLAIKLVSAVMESLTLPPKYVQKIFEDGNQLMVTNCYPACPQPDLTLGLPAHSDYGCITILLQDAVGGLQVQHNGQWKAVRPVPNSFVVNIGDHLEIMTNGRYKSVIHRAVVNSERSRVSVATLFTIHMEAHVCPAPELIDEHHPQMFRDTSFAEFLKSMATNELREKDFLNSLRIVNSAKPRDSIPT